MNLLEFYIPEWFFVALSLVILVLILRRLLWKPVTRILDDRQQKVTQALDDAREIELEKDNMKKRRQEAALELDQLTAEKMKDARARAGKEYDRIIEDAEEKARLIIASAQAQAARECERMLQSARREVITSALAAAEALLEENMDNERNEQFVRTFISKRGAQG